MTLDTRIRAALAAKDYAEAGQLALRAAGRLSQAEAPKYFTLAADCYFRCNDLVRAIRAARQAGNDPEALKILALSYSRQRRAAPALAALTQLEAAVQNPVAVLILKALVMRNLGAQHHQTAREALEDALKLDPTSTTTRVNLALVLCFLRDREAAWREIEILRALPGAENQRDFQLIILSWLDLNERYDEVLELVRTRLESVRSEPIVARAELNAAIRTSNIPLAEERLQFFKKVPGREDLYLSALARIVKLKGDWVAFKQVAEQSLTLSEQTDESDIRSAATALELELTPRGWHAYVKWKQEEGQTGTRFMPALGLPWHRKQQWPPPGAAACVVECCQGLGDFLMFLRWLPEVVARAPERQFVLRIPDALYPLLSRSLQLERVRLQPVSDEVEGVDAAVLLDELPHLLSSPQPPAAWPQLSAMPAHIERVRNARKYPDRPLIVLAWQGNTKQSMDEGRSLSPEMLEPLLRRHADGEIELFSIQRDVPAGLQDRMTVMADLDEAVPFEDSLAAMALAQLTITSDTSLAHLAGLAGVKSEVLLQFFAEWRWGLGDHNRWYPAQKMARQDRPGDWASAIAKMALPTPVVAHQP
ncbi:hypothetical protein [Radicibacter daui]|uniref:hypothetical protein n=1 Tax=Radicibacter daui TaxID=3064829 RepID=UPI004046E90D